MILATDDQEQGTQVDAKRIKYCESKQVVVIVPAVRLLVRSVLFDCCLIILIASQMLRALFHW
jgi:hypothetical protein